MASIPQLRPRSAEADGVLSRVSSEHAFEADVMAKASSGAGEGVEHSHSAMSAQVRISVHCSIACKQSFHLKNTAVLGTYTSVRHLIYHVLVVLLSAWCATSG